MCLFDTCWLCVHTDVCVCVGIKGHTLPDLISYGHMYICICWEAGGTTQRGKYKDELDNQVLFSDTSSCEMFGLLAIWTLMAQRLGLLCSRLICAVYHIHNEGSILSGPGSPSRRAYMSQNPDQRHI